MVSVTGSIARSLLEHVPHAVVLLYESRIIYLNRAAAELLGDRENRSFIGSDFLQKLRSGRLPDFTGRRGGLRRYGRGSDRLLRADGSFVDVCVETCHFDSGGLRLIQVYLSGAKRGGAEASVTAQPPASAEGELLGPFFATLPILFLQLDGKGTILQCGRPRSANVPFDPAEYVGRCLIELLPAAQEPEFRSVLRRACAEQSVTSLEFDVPGGPPPRSFECRLIPYQSDRLIAIFQDTTDSRRIERRRRRARRMESIGRLAGGIAHDFNNLLTAVVAHGEFARAEASADSALARHLDQILVAADRAADLTRRLLSFSGSSLGSSKVVDLRTLAGGLTGLFTRLLGDQVQLHVRLSPAPCPVRANPQQLERMLTHLVLNARDAMPDGGSLAVAIRPVRVGPVFAERHGEIQPGKYIQIVVRDTGVGICAEIEGRIFEPFFTTKQQGERAGLGLATCYGIIKHLEGHVSALSRPNSGTSFLVYLPESTERPAEPDPPAVARSLHGTGTILLVEDEALVREVTAKSLASFGYDVLVAEDGQHGLEVARGHSGRIDALVTDVVMPRLGGRDLAARLRLQIPSLKVLYISGYTHSSLDARDLKKPGTAFLHKPFSPTDLGGQLRDLLGRN